MTETLALAEHGRTFATRERARDILAATPATAFSVNFRNVRAVAPGFLSELFFGILKRTDGELDTYGWSDEIWPTVDRAIDRVFEVWQDADDD